MRNHRIGALLLFLSTVVGITGCSGTRSFLYESDAKLNLNFDEAPNVLPVLLLQLRDIGKFEKLSVVELRQAFDGGRPKLEEVLGGDLIDLISRETKGLISVRPDQKDMRIGFEQGANAHFVAVCAFFNDPEDDATSKCTIPMAKLSGTTVRFLSRKLVVDGPDAQPTP